MDKILNVISDACLAHRDTGELSCNMEARRIIEALKKDGFEIKKVKNESN